MQQALSSDKKKKKKERKKKKKPHTTHGGNYGILLRQECSHDGQWDLTEVAVAS